MQEPQTILIVDDEPDLCEMLVFEFSTKGYRALAVPDGRQALRLLEREPISVVISDIRMPHIDGFELLAQLKSSDVRRPVMVLMSAYADVSLEEAHGRGAEALFSKPFRLADLEEAVQSLLQPALERWAQAPLTPPVQHLRQHAASLDAGRGSQIINLGRGGVFLATSDTPPFPGQPVQFTVDFDEGPLSCLAGVGVIQWYRAPKAPSVLNTCGIAFSYLEERCREAVIARIEHDRPMAFIPTPAYL